jgi:hypothetical protein
MPKGVLLAGTNAARAGLCVLLALSTDNVLVIYLIAVALAVGSQFSGPAEGAALPSVVEPEELVAANSLNNLGSLIAQIVGLILLPAVFLKTVGAPPLAILCAAMFGASAVGFITVEGLGGPVSKMHITIEETRERFAEAWHRLTLDSVAYISVIILVLANTTGLVVATLLPRFASDVLGVSAENIIFVAAPAAIGIWLAMRMVSNVSARVSPWWTVGGSYAVMVGGLIVLVFVAPLGDALQRINPLGIFDPGPFGDTSARIMISSVLGAVLAFSFTFVNIVARTIVNERIPREMQGRVLAAQGVLTNLASIPPILLTGLLADLVGVPPVFFIVALTCGMAALFLIARNLAAPAIGRPA